LVGWAGVAGGAGGLVVAEGGVGRGGAVKGEAVGAVGGCKSMGDAELAKGVLLGLLSVASVLSVAL
jgi:hypothetical protein